MKNLYFIEVTDTFGGEANYSWATRHVIKAKSERGAINTLSRRSGINWHCVDHYDQWTRYDSKSGATCAFVEEYDPEIHADFRFDTDDRTFRDIRSSLYRS